MNVSIESGCLVASGISARKVSLLKSIIRDTFWMARRYAHGRHTYTPSMVRDAYKILKKHFPDLVPQSDITITPMDVVHGMSGKHGGNLGDYLHDCND